MEDTSKRFPSDRVHAGWVELGHRRWGAARSCFEQALADGETPEAFEGLSWSAWWLDDAETVFTTRERAYRLYRTRADGALPPLLWGSEEHVRELFGERVSSIEMTRKRYVERSPGGPREYVELFKETFGPLVALHASLADRPERRADLDRDLLDFAMRSNQGTPEGPAEYHYEYLLVIARMPEHA